jgi:hypothetical protein
MPLPHDTRCKRRRHFLPAAFLICLSAIASGTRARADELSTNQQARLHEYAKAAVRHFSSKEANNLTVGFAHTAYGTGRYRTLAAGNWIETNMRREVLSHVNINEVTLRFNGLAAAYRMTNWIEASTEGARYSNSWGQVLTGLRSLRYLQTNADANAHLRYGSGTYHRAYWTTWSGSNDYVLADIHRDDSDRQSSDDNGLPFMNLLVLEGLANSATTMPGGARIEITNLCQQIRAAIQLSRFVVEDRIVHEFSNGIASVSYWDRLAAEGPVVLAALWLSGQVTTGRFQAVLAGMENHRVYWTTSAGAVLIERPSYHGAMFMHGLRALHGMPVTTGEWAGVDFFSTSTKPMLAAHLDFASGLGFRAVGSQIMSQAFEGRSMVKEPASENQARFPGNEDNVAPLPLITLALGSAPHAWFIPLGRWWELDTNDVATLFDWMSLYEPAFFQTGSSTSLGWEACIPWAPDDTTYSWVDETGRTNFTDHGRPVEALNSSYVLLSTFDALNPSTPLSSFNVEKSRVGRLAALFDGVASGVRIVGLSGIGGPVATSVVQAISGAVYQAQSTDDLNHPSAWSNVSGVMTSQSASLQIACTNLSAGRFLRVEMRSYPPLP